MLFNPELMLDIPEFWITKLFPDPDELPEPDALPEPDELPELEPDELPEPDPLVLSNHFAFSSSDDQPLVPVYGFLSAPSQVPNMLSNDEHSSHSPVGVELKNPVYSSL